MNILGIVAEYNPFHNGHLYHLNKSKELANADFIIAIMSGSFVQRGEPAILDKWTRANIAISQGVDLVIELPILYALNPAEDFALGAIKILKEIGIVNYISFGSECGEIKILENVADIFIKEPPEFKNNLNYALQSGSSYPSALSYALSNTSYLNMDYSSILNTPNNVLGIEYIKAIKKLNMKIGAITIARNNFFIDYNTGIQKKILSATEIREFIKKDIPFHQDVPYESFEYIMNNLNNNNISFGLEFLENIILYKIRSMSISEIANISEVTEGLEFKIKKAGTMSNNLNELISNIKSKRYTEAKIKRILCKIILNITKKDVDNAKKIKPYLRVLAANKNGKMLISEIAKKNINTEIIVSCANYLKSSINKNKKHMLEKEILATDIYGLSLLQTDRGSTDLTTNILKK